MAFEWLGTFNRSQFDRFSTYAREQLTQVDARINHLVAEQQRVGFLRFIYDSAGRPTAYSTGSAGSGPTYIGKLIAAYEVLGGDPFFDLQTRAIQDQPLYFPKGTETAAGKIMSNGEPIPQKGLADAPTAKLVHQMKAWIRPSLDRRSQLERKIRRAVDYGDQLQSELDTLKLMKLGLEVRGSLENLMSEVHQMISDPHYRAVGDDKGADPFGKLAYAPLSSYEPGPGREAPDGLAVERTSKGYSISGEGGS